MTLFSITHSPTLRGALGSLLVAALMGPLAAQAASSKVAPGNKAATTVSKSSAKKPVVAAKASASKTVAAKGASKGKVLAQESRGKASKREVLAKAVPASTARMSKAEQRRAMRLAERAEPRGKKAHLAKSGKHARHQAELASNAVAKPAFVRVSLSPQRSAGDRLGLRAAEDPLELNSSVALVIDQVTGEVLFSKNDSAVLPIASLTKLMTGLVLADAHLPMDEMITITQDDVDTYKNSSSRLAVGTTLSRGEMMHLALMSSENRAAHALGRTYPGGLTHFVRLMNAKAQEIGMRDTRYVDPTGLMSQNQSSARDLATLVGVAYERPILRDLSTSPSYQLSLGDRTLQYNNTNRLIRNPEWDIGLQKTGYISEAGRCLVMQANVADRHLIMVFLDASGRLGRAQDAERVRHWVEAQRYQRVASRPQG